MDGNTFLSNIHIDVDVMIIALFFFGDAAEILNELYFVLAEIFVQLDIIHIQILNIILWTQYGFLKLRSAFLFEKSKRRICLRGALTKHALSLAQEAVLVQLSKLIWKYVGSAAGVGRHHLISVRLLLN